MTTRLSAKALAALGPDVAVPAYDPAALRPGIVHFGLGNFHRAHQAVYLDDLFNLGRDQDWGVLGAGVMPGDAAIRDALAPQDWLGTVVEQEADHSSARITGAVCGFLPPADGPAILAAMTAPEIRIVSMTITEGGYFVNPATGRFDPAHPAMAADAASPTAPKTVFGLIVAALAARRAAGIAPFTVMSCDNIPHNGAVARDAVMGLARLSDPALCDWIGANVTFPNGMVDRITPATSARERRIAAEDFGVEDAWPVFCEGFRQWVLEDKFCNGRPALEAVGVEFVEDVTPYEKMKIRILNGGHAVIAYPAGLLGIEYVHEAMQDPQISGFLAKIEAEEIIPATTPPAGVSLEAYAAKVAERFANPKIADTIRRLCLDGSNRQPKFIIPTIADRLTAGGSVAGLALESALWRKYCFGRTEAGEAIAPNDPNWDRLTAQAQASAGDAAIWLDMDDIYGDVGRDAGFRAAFNAAAARIDALGVRGALAAYLEG